MCQCKLLFARPIGEAQNKKIRMEEEEEIEIEEIIEEEEEQEEEQEDHKQDGEELGNDHYKRPDLSITTAEFVGV